MTKVKNLFSKLVFGLLAFTMMATMASGIVGNSQVLPDVCPEDGCAITGDTEINDDNGGRDAIVGLLLDLATLLTYIAGAVAVLFLVYGGFLFIVDPGGSGDGATKGKKIIFNALIGLVICIVAFTIVNLVGSLVTTTDFSN